MKIRKANNSDLIHISSVSKTTWNATYNGILSQKFIDEFIEKAYSIEKLKVRLEKSILYVAQEHNEIVGFINISNGINGIFELVALYVLPKFQGKGIGRMLLENSIQNMENIIQISVNVEQDNANAIKFYDNNGFKEIEYFEEVFLGEVLKTVKMVRYI